MSMVIIGAGMAGLLAGQMLRRHSPVILEAKTSLPDNHKALLRFRSTAVSDACGIPFRHVRAVKAMYWAGEWFNESNVAANNLYAAKVVGRVIPRSIGSLGTFDRWIAPDDFPKLLAQGLNIQFNTAAEIIADHKEHEPWVSTVPLPLVANGMLKLKKVPPMNWSPIYVARAELPESVDVYQTLYFPGLEPYYRASISGHTMIVEAMQPLQTSLNVGMLFRQFGLPEALQPEAGWEFSEQKFGKILPTDEKWRKEFIMELTRRNNIYSLGRFATWRNILLDDLVQDVRIIDQLISGDRHVYEHVARG